MRMSRDDDLVLVLMAVLVRCGTMSDTMRCGVLRVYNIRIEEVVLFIDVLVIRVLKVPQERNINII